MKLRGELQGQTNIGTQHRSHKVRLGDGNHKSTQGCCKNLKIQLGAYTMVGDFFLFELGGVDLILGVA